MTPETTITIKEGDTVVCIQGTFNNFGANGGSGWELGLEFVVAQITSDPLVGQSIYWGAKSGHGVFGNWLQAKVIAPMKKLTTKEEFLNKLLEGVEVMLAVKEMNIKENEMIDEFINSLKEEMKSPEQREQEKKKKEKEEQQKKDKEQAEQEAQKQGGQQGNPQNGQGQGQQQGNGQAQATPGTGQQDPNGSGQPQNSQTGGNQPSEVDVKKQSLMKTLKELKEKALEDEAQGKVSPKSSPVRVNKSASKKKVEKVKNGEESDKGEEAQEVGAVSEGEEEGEPEDKKPDAKSDKGKEAKEPEEDVDEEDVQVNAQKGSAHVDSNVPMQEVAPQTGGIWCAVCEKYHYDGEED